MRPRFCLSVFIPLFLVVTSLSAQQQPPRDERATAILQQSFAVMGGAVPADSVATGTVTIVAGSKTDSGTVRILTRGLSQSLEEIQTPDGTQSEVFSDGVGAVKVGLEQKEKSLEWASSAQSTMFPLVFIISALSNPDTAFEYVGLESLDGASAHHVKFWNTFAAKPKLQHLAEFSVKHIWIDAVSNLPTKLAFDRRDGGGATPRIPMAYQYSDYRSVTGTLFPFQIQKDVNGTPWGTIRIGSVAFNTGLSESAFAIQ